MASCLHTRCKTEKVILHILFTVNEIGHISISSHENELIKLKAKKLVFL